MQFPRVVHVLAAVIFLPAFAAYADTVTTFQFAGTYDFGSPPDYTGSLGTASGTVTIDTTTGTLEAINLTTPALLSNRAGAGSAISYSYGPPLNFTQIGETWTGVPGINYYADITLNLPVATLAGYTGGNICSLDNPCANGPSSIVIGFDGGDFVDGTLALTPEPSSLAFLATGALGIFGMTRRRLLRA